MPYLVDSDWVIDHLSNIPVATQLLSDFAPQGLYISIVTYMEVYQGALRTDNPSTAIQELKELIEQVPVLPITSNVAERCARLREDLRKQGKRPNRRALDLLIAATALENDLTLVTRNVRDYADIPGLQIYPRTPRR